MTHLCVSVHLLDPLYHGRGDREPEWPPSPMRLFQALVAGSRLDLGREEVNAAFGWLEKQPPPLIVAPRAQATSGYTMFIPNNDGDRVFDRQDRLAEKEMRPYRLLDETPIHYVWDATDEDHVRVLCQAARRLTTFGWGIDAAFACGQLLSDGEVAALPGVRWKAWTTIGSGSRVPKEGTLRNLSEAYQSFLGRIDGKTYRPPSKPSVFSTAAYQPAESLPPRPTVAYTLEHPCGDGKVAFLPTNAVVVAGMLRSRTCAAAQGDPHWNGNSESYVAGHIHAEETQSRFSYLPLPSVGHPHADGLIRRVLIAEPYGVTGEHTRWARQRLRHEELIDEKSSQARAVLMDADAQDSVLPNYLDPSQDWQTVTPVVLPGHDSGRREKAERLLIRAIEQAGVSMGIVQDLTLQKAPFLRQSQHARQYRRPRHMAGLPAWHVRLQFKSSVSGPITVGAGRYCGLGLFSADRS